jgi:hypothetical protein
MNANDKLLPPQKLMQVSALVVVEVSEKAVLESKQYW